MKWIALLRGINVGGKNKLPMAELRDQLTGLGFENVQTYIQSGNVVFDADISVDLLTKKIADNIETNYGFRPQIMVLSADSLRASIGRNPFSVEASTGNLLHFFFLSEPALNIDLDKIKSLAAPTEKWHLTERVFYLYAPDGVARSKLMAGAEKALGVVTTARNWRTVIKLDEMAE